MVKGLCEVLWFKKLMIDIDLAPNSEMNLFCDNKADIDITHKPIQHDHTKYYEVDRHFIKQNLEAKVIQFLFIKLKDQLVDILTKAVSTKLFYNSLGKLDMWNIYAPT